MKQMNRKVAKMNLPGEEFMIGVEIFFDVDTLTELLEFSLLIFPIETTCSKCEMKHNFNR